MTNSSILARIRLALIDVCLTTRSGEAAWTRAFEAVDHIVTCSSIHARSISTFVDINFTLNAGETC